MKEEKLKEFWITSTISVMAKDKKEADELLKKYETRREIAEDLLDNAEINEADL